MTKKMKKGFTITELVIVIAVIAILAAVLIPTFSYVVGNAKKSAALQTCKNGLTNYQSQVGTDDNPSNDNTAGMVFVYDGYAYAYISGALQYVGELEDLATYTADNKDFATVENIVTVSGSPAEGTAQALTITLSPTAEKEEDIVAKMNESDLLAGATINEVELTKKTAENLYFYSIKVNNTTYVGYFTLEKDDNPMYTSESAIYSRACGYVVGTMTLNIGA